MLYKGRIIKDADTILFGMPSLEDARQEEGQEEDPLLLQQRIEDIERQAYEKGFAAGEKAGLQMGEQKALLLLEGLEKVINELKSLKDNIPKELEPQVFDLAVALAKRIVIEELTINPEVIVRIVKEALRKLERSGAITIKINPALYDLFVKLKPELTEIHPEIVFDVDPSVSVNGPLVIGPVEEVVTDIDTQIANIVEDIRGELGTR